MSTFERMRWSGMSGDVVMSFELESCYTQQATIVRMLSHLNFPWWPVPPCSVTNCNEINHQHKCRRDIGVTSPHSSCSSLAEMLLWAKMGSWHQSLDVTKTPITKTLHRSLSCPVYSKQQSITACKKRPGFRRERLHSSPCQFLQISSERATKTWLHSKPSLLNSASLLQILKQLSWGHCQDPTIQSQRCPTFRSSICRNWPLPGYRCGAPFCPPPLKSRNCISLLACRKGFTCRTGLDCQTNIGMNEMMVMFCFINIDFDLENTPSSDSSGLLVIHCDSKQQRLIYW